MGHSVGTKFAALGRVIYSAIMPCKTLRDALFSVISVETCCLILFVSIASPSLTIASVSLLLAALYWGAFFSKSSCSSHYLHGNNVWKWQVVWKDYIVCVLITAYLIFHFDELYTIVNFKSCVVHAGAPKWPFWDILTQISFRNELYTYTHMYTWLCNPWSFIRVDQLDCHPGCEWTQKKIMKSKYYPICHYIDVTSPNMM